MKILHISDLHFGYDKDDTMKVQREAKLIALNSVVKNQNIDLVIVTGDITWQGKESGYIDASAWLTELLKQLSISKDRLIVCPGNHDIDHDKCIDMEYQNNKETVGKSLRQERIATLSDRFHRFIKWCTDFGITKYKLGSNENYLVGSIVIDDVEFWILNSAWYALKGGAEDKGKLWMGDNFIDVISSNSASSSKLRFALHHHPYEWINENETLAYSTTNCCLYRKLSQHVQCAFTGHTHALQSEPNKYQNQLYCFGTGATYADSSYNNCFSIYDIDKENAKLKYTSYIVDEDKWKPRKTGSVDLSASDEDRRADDTFVVPETVNLNNVTGFKRLLEENEFSLLKVNASDFLVNHTIIWPVVPRLNLNNIHLAQLELMEQLVKQYGWNVLAIISNCGARPLSENDTLVFIEKIQKRCDSIGIQNITFELLKDYFDNKPTISNEILHCFMKVSSFLPISELSDIKEKKYDEQKRAGIKQQPVLDYIVPVLQYAVIMQVAKEIQQNEGKKSVVIAGNDEKHQWRRAVNIIGDDCIGAILIPELNNQEGQNISLDSEVPSVRSIIQCSSMNELREAMQIDSVAQWFYRMFVFLANHKDITKSEIFKKPKQEAINPIIWQEKGIPDTIDREKLIKSAWARIERDI